MKTTFHWTCPHCGHLHAAEHVDAELGPFESLVCSECDKVADVSNLSSSDYAAWNAVINAAQSDQ